MDKIKYVKVNCVNFNAIDVPVNVCNKSAHLVIPFVCATKHLKDENGYDISVAYSIGLNEKKERLIIKYYNDYLIRMALYDIYRDRERKSILREAFERNNAYFDSWFEGNFFTSLGLRAYSSYGAVDIVCKLLKKFSDEEKESWCVEYINNYFAEKRLVNEWSDYADNIEDMKLLSSLSNDYIEQAIENLLIDDAWYKRFTKQILLPYIKENTLKAKLEKERKELDSEIAELEKQLLNIKAKREKLG